MLSDSTGYLVPMATVLLFISASACNRDSHPNGARSAHTARGEDSLATVSARNSPGMMSASDDPAQLRGVIENNSTRNVTIVAENARYCLRPGRSSSGLVQDADGMLLSGTPVLLQPNDATVEGGGRVHTTGAIKVCSLGKLTIEDMPGPLAQMRATISWWGHGNVVCPGDPAGYKSPEWVRARGWDQHPLRQPC